MHHAKLRNITLKSGLLAFAAGIGLCAAGHAQAQAQPSAQQACAQDYQTFCSGVQPGGGRIKACFEQNFSNLSPVCQQALKAKALQ